MLNAEPLISFTFDDFPRSSFRTGGQILKAYGFLGTYYASLGLMGRDSPVGPIFSADDLADLVAQGHELGCHTYDHCDAWKTDTRVFERSIAENRRRLRVILGDVQFCTHSYPVNYPRLPTKRVASEHFACCRCGGESFNAGRADLGLLKGFFLERGRDDPGWVQEVIRENNRARGWLIFVTHDLSDSPTPFGCKPAFFDAIVRFSAGSGARVLPVGQALAVVTKASAGSSR
jgi:peptidoglycan/xylan/chitin deacetylase (PgdA/CDA1 family)